MSKPSPIVKPSTQPQVQIGITLVHGLLTKDEGSWSERLMEWGNEHSYADFSMLKYWEGVIGWGHQEHVDLLEKLLRKELAQWAETGKQHVIAHSNGVRLTLEALVKNDDLRLDDLHLIAGWAPRDCRKHINIILQRKQAKRIFLYVSKADDTLGWNKLWPFYFSYTLGKYGPTYAVPSAVEKKFLELNPASESPLWIGRDDTQKHCSWVDPRKDTDDPGFNLLTFTKILSLSAPSLVAA